MTMAYCDDYPSAGLRVIPIRHGQKVPALNDWPNQATDDPTTIERWLDAGHGLGVALGRHKDSWIFAIDVDGISHGVNGEATLVNIEATYGALPSTWEAVTGGGGRHLLYKSPVEIRNGKLNGGHGDGIDIRGNGGQIVVEPSLHPSQMPYFWREGRAPWECEIADAPEWLISLVESDRSGPVSTSPPQSPPLIDTTVTELRPGDRWAATVTWEQLLERDGWTLHHVGGDGEQHWTRPGKDARAGTSATVGYGGSDVLKVFSTSAFGLTAEATYSRFGYLAAVHFDGDYRAAAQALTAAGHGSAGAKFDPMAWIPAIEETTVGGVDDEPELHGWEPIALADYVSGEYQRPAPSLLRRLDGMALLYSGRVNTLIGESGGGKSWVSQAAIAQVLLAGGRVTVIDLEDHVGSYIDRLRRLGVDGAVIAGRLTYIAPERSLSEASRSWLLAHCETQDLVVIDSVGESMALEGTKPNDDDDTARWFRLLPRAVATLGPAVVTIDHLPKDPNRPSGFAIGSQRKRAAIDGVMLEVEVGVAPARNVVGHLKLIARKDRTGNFQHGAKVADIEIEDRIDGSIRVDIKAPSSVERPTVLMERVSRYLEQFGPCSRENTEKNVTGKASMLRKAIEVLVVEEWIDMRPRPGRGGGFELVSLRPFRDDSGASWVGNDPVDNPGDREVS